jgi:putative hydrolase of the HAD superfamily
MAIPHSVNHFQGVRAVVFDGVGTLIHPHPPAPIVYADIGKSFGSKLTVQAIADRFQTAFKQEEEIDRVNENRTSELREIERWRRIVSVVLDDVEDTEACFQQLFEHFARSESWSCDPDAGEVLEFLAGQGYRLGIASNYDRRLRSVIAGLPSLQLLRHQIISSEVGWRKPALQFFAALCGTLGVQPQQSLYIGDDPVNDFAGATAAGLQALVFDPKDRSALPDASRIGSLKDLRERLF